MPIRSKAHEHDGEQRACGIEPVASIEALELTLIAACRGIRARAIGRDRMDVLLGRADTIEKEAVRHADVAQAIVRRHEAIIAHEPMHARPRHFAA